MEFHEEKTAYQDYLAALVDNSLVDELKGHLTLIKNLYEMHGRSAAEFTKDRDIFVDQLKGLIVRAGTYLELSDETPIIEVLRIEDAVIAQYRFFKKRLVLNLGDIFYYFSNIVKARLTNDLDAEADYKATYWNNLRRAFPHELTHFKQDTDPTISEVQKQTCLEASRQAQLGNLRLYKADPLENQAQQAERGFLEMEADFLSRNLALDGDPTSMNPRSRQMLAELNGIHDLLQVG